MKNSFPPRCPDSLFGSVKYAEIKAHAAWFETMQDLGTYLGMVLWAIPQAAIDAAGLEAA